jgi:aspartate/methionine/tyrosine aminotransferase
MRDRIMARIRENLALLAQALRDSPFRALPCDGGWTAVIQAPRTKSEEQWTLDLLRDHDTLVQPGFFYDFESEAFLVVSLLTPPETLAEGIRRLLIG